MKIGIAGPQGSGKSTQAQILSKKFNLCLIDCGNLIRQKAKDKDSVGKRTFKSLEKGELVDDQIVAEVFRNRVGRSDCKLGFIADGYPRRLSQLKVFDPQFNKMIYLDVSDQAVEKRLLFRGRFDDTPSLIKKRLAVYHQNINPVLDFYQRKGKLIKVDGSRSVTDVTKEIIKDLKND